MGLSGRKTKQRIPNDPRNLAWADDAAKFGQSYLSKLGWDPSKGLGPTGDGRTSHIQVSQKLNMLGIGAAQQNDPNGIAWKQNKEFESLLKRLNENLTPEVGGPEGADNDAAEVLEDDEVRLEKDGEVTVKNDATSGKKEKKRKRSKDDVDESERKKKREKKKEYAASESAVVLPTPSTTLAPAMRHRGHRARFIASKSLANKSSAAISEILGIAPMSSTPSTSTTPPGTLTPLDESVTLEKLTTSTKSVADYFKERLLAKSSKSLTASPLERASEDGMVEEAYDALKLGLGSSRARTKPDSESGAAAAIFSSMFKASLATSTPPDDTEATQNTDIERDRDKKRHKSESQSLDASPKEASGENHDVSSDSGQERARLAKKQVKEARKKEKAEKKARKQKRRSEKFS